MAAGCPKRGAFCLAPSFNEGVPLLAGFLPRCAASLPPAGFRNQRRFRVGRFLLRRRLRYLLGHLARSLLDRMRGSLRGFLAFGVLLSCEFLSAALQLIAALTHQLIFSFGRRQRSPEGCAKRKAEARQDQRLVGAELQKILGCLRCLPRCRGRPLCNSRAGAACGLTGGSQLLLAGRIGG